MTSAQNSLLHQVLIFLNLSLLQVFPFTPYCLPPSNTPCNSHVYIVFSDRGLSLSPGRKFTDGWDLCLSGSWYTISAALLFAEWTVTPVYSERHVRSHVWVINWWVASNDHRNVVSAEEKQPCPFLSEGFDSGFGMAFLGHEPLPLQTGAPALPPPPWGRAAHSRSAEAPLLSLPLTQWATGEPRTFTAFLTRGRSQQSPGGKLRRRRCH